MKARVFFAVIGAFLVAVAGYAWYQHRERVAQQERDAADARKSAELKRRQEAAKKKKALSEREERAEEVRLNEPERHRLQRRYPELWAELKQRAGVDPDRCVVTITGEQRLAEPDAKGRLPDLDIKPVLRARCGEKLDQNY